MMTPVILSGGSGTRLWPVSRESYPKQFCEFFDRSFLVNTWERVQPLGSPMVVTLKSMGALTTQSLQPHGLKIDDLILEPMGKNTAVAVALLCWSMAKRGKQDEIVGVFPADHLISQQVKFRAAVSLAAEMAEKGYLVTLGIEPRYPATGFGYIEVQDQVIGQAGDGLRGLAVKGFREKPNLAVATEFYRSGAHFWNAGIFVFKVSDMMANFRKHLPEVWRKIETLQSDMENLSFVYANMESISLDHGIAEKCEKLACVPVEIGWSDVGSWDEVSRLSEETPEIKVDSKAVVAQVSAVNNFVFSQSPKVIGLAGVEDLIVVDTPDALLVTKKTHSELVKDLVKNIREQGLPQALGHRFETRPWGKFESLHEEAQFKVKKIEVEPGQQLSYQSHQKRAETWLIIAGQAEVVLNDDTHVKKAGEVIQIPTQAKHRIRNPGTERLVFVEVQTGEYFGEDDITRYEDNYGRA